MNVDEISQMCDLCKGGKRVRLFQRGYWNYRCGYDKRVLCCAPPNYGTWMKSSIGDLVLSKWFPDGIRPSTPKEFLNDEVPN